jgi:L,D-transpeptidase YcbB
MRFDRIWLLAAPAALFGAVACGSQDGGTARAQSEAAALVDPERVEPRELQAVVSDERVRAFYEARNWRPAWTRDSVPSLVDALRGAARHGLDPDVFLRPAESAPDPARREGALTKAALDLADALGDGLVDPSEIFELYTLPRPEHDLVAGLSQAVADNRAGEWLEGLAPDSAEYRALSRAYLRYAGEAASGDRGRIEEGEAIREGDSDPRVPRIAEVLRANGHLGEDEQPAGEGDRYTAAMAAAVERLQEDFGIAADGIVGPDTLEVLNAGAGDRARTLAVNLERLRWLERQPPPTRIDVNIAAATLDYYRDGSHSDRRNVVVGQPGWETPQLGSPIYRLVANPTWTVPKSIEEEEIAPRGEGYLRRNNMVRRDGWIVQMPGPDNALGLVKFDMHNDHAIYLHDTPAKPLFQRNQRFFSHGCVRVENAEEFARLLARADGVLPEYEQARVSGNETFVNLTTNIPVRLLYLTAFADRSGNVVFRTDAYGWDDRVAEALGYSARQTRRIRAHISDVGP